MPREIVLGVRDHVSPHGRVTVEVRDDRTGRVKRRVRKDNAVMDFIAPIVVDVDEAVTVSTPVVADTVEVDP